MKGKVKWFSKRRSFGFIIAEDGKEIFVHYTGIQMEGFKILRQDQEVEFDVVTTSKGVQAVNVIPGKNKEN